MKSILTLSIILLSTICYGQIYYQSQNAKSILTEEQYSKLKKYYVKRGIKVREEFDKTFVRSDSTIRRFKLRLTAKDDPYEKLNILINKPFPNFIMEKINGDKITISTFKGKPVFVNIWFTGCVPCLEKMPKLNLLVEKYKNKVEFVSITFNSIDEVKNFLNKKEFNFTHIINAKKLINKMKINSFPTNIILDKNGIISFINARAVEFNENDFEEELEKYIQ